MKKRFMIFLALLMLSPKAFSHRLNEYLEAATINVSRGKVLIAFRLTPGVDVAAIVLKDIDLNNDNRISTAEQGAYVAKLSRDISLTLDGRRPPLKPVFSSFPSIEALKKGVGDIMIEYEIKIEQEGSFHQLTLKNNHHTAIAVYLVNCLLPADTGISIAGQTRNASQSVYQLDFLTGLAQPATSADQQRLLKKADHRAVIKTYFVHGVQHILSGYDHLLFLCALVLGAVSLWDLIKIVTAFTIAHSITLTLATLGYANVPEQVVEPIIAASIVFVAVQNIAWPKQAGGYSRLAIAFFFGLFHGLGFAGGLLDLMHAMPADLILYSILGFSLGVEAGNQLVLLPLYGGLQWLRRTRIQAEKSQELVIFQRYASGGVAVAGMYYLCTNLYAYL